MIHKYSVYALLNGMEESDLLAINIDSDTVICTDPFICQLDHKVEGLI